MPKRARLKSRIVLTSTLLTVLLIGGLAFVFHYMHAVYEAEEYVEEEDLPLAVRQNFAALFPGIDAQWKFEDELYEAEFSWKGKEETEAYFAPPGTLVRTEFPIAFDELPEKARHYLTSQKGLKVRDAERIEPPGAPPTYGAELRSLLKEWDCIFDADGNLITSTRDGSTLEE